jgi:sulfane dehydrogenase subunit SoxC
MWRRPLSQAKAQIKNSESREAIMDSNSNPSGRRRFLKQAAALAGVAAGAGAGAEWAARGQSAGSSAKSESQSNDAHIHGDERRGVRRNINHITYFTPLQDYEGIITPASLHFVQLHTSYFPVIDAQQHRLTIHGMVDRPLSFSMDDLKRLPSVSRIHFVECQANGAPMGHENGNENMGLPVQYVWGMTSCSEWSGVPLSVLLNEAGVQAGASWVISEGAEAGKWSHTIPLAKAMDDVIVAYGQNGEPLRPEQGYPLRLLVPGWEGLNNVKYLRHIKLVDHHLDPTGVNHAAIVRADLGDKYRWYHFQWGPKSVITRPSGGLKIPGQGYVQITGLAWSGGGAVSKVDVSTDGGRSWKEAKLQAPVLPKAHTRFTFDWAWNGEEAVIQSRCTDDQGEVQPSVAELYKNWGITGEEAKKAVRTTHFNAMQPWKVARDGSVSNAMFS